MTNKIVLATALTGARYSPWLLKDTKDVALDPKFYAQHMPITPEQVTQDVRGSYTYGARFFHVHARNPQTGAQWANLDWYDKVAQGIREIDPNVVISFPTSRKMEVGKGIEDRLKLLEMIQKNSPGRVDRAYAEFKVRGVAVEAHPDTLTTFTVPEVTMLGNLKNRLGVEETPGWTDPEVMKLYYEFLIQRTKELGVMQEIEITTMGQFDVLKRMAESGKYHMDAPMHFVVLLGFSDGLPIDKKTYEVALKEIEDLRKGVEHPAVITVGAVIPPQKAKKESSIRFEPGKHDYHEVMQWVTDDHRVGLFRVGLEDTPELYGKQRKNAELVAHAAEFFDKKGVEIVTDAHVLREAFGLPYKPTSEIKPVSALKNLLEDVISKLFPNK